MRYANRVPLLFQPSGCCITKSVADVDWRRYGLSQPGGNLPMGPLAIFVHKASVWVPFTSEGKESIADYDEIRKEIRPPGHGSRHGCRARSAAPARRTAR
jgi:DNA topoisomerase-6 subunit B